MKSSELIGAVDWIKDIMERHQEDPNFVHTCHKTDPKADGYSGAKKIRECTGHIKMIMNGHDKKPGRGGVYDTMEQLIKRYLSNWLGPVELEKIRKNVVNSTLKGGVNIQR